MNKFEQHLVGQCAPTLAGIKLGSLFHYVAAPDEDIQEIVRRWSTLLQSKGVSVCILRAQGNCALIYVFRPAMLEKLLSSKDAAHFLKNHGFDAAGNPDACIDQLQKRFSHQNGFPHEIGLFLGYPLHDVVGFIEHKGRDFCLCGLWKVYDKPSVAEKIFAQYKKCLNIYQAMFEKGASIFKLTVAVWRPEYIF